MTTNTTTTIKVYITRLDMHQGLFEAIPVPDAHAEYLPKSAVPMKLSCLQPNLRDAVMDRTIDHMLVDLTFRKIDEMTACKWSNWRSVPV